MSSSTPPERAFAVFVEQFDRIKPRDHNLMAAPVAETIFEPRVGGTIHDRAEDGTVCHWARVLAYEPPHRVVFSWDISPRWQVKTDPDRCARRRRRGRRLAALPAALRRPARRPEPALAVERLRLAGPFPDMPDPLATYV